MLVVKIDLEQNKENYKAVLKALEEFEIISASWQDEESRVSGDEPKLRTSSDPSDIGAALSSAVDRIRRNGG